MNASRASPLSLFDLVPTLMMGAAIGFLVLVAPIDLIERIVVRSGLPALLPAARPPLGETARAMLAGASGVIASVAAWAALGMVARLGARRPASTDDPMPANRAPVLRRLDRHPDAPARRPLFVTEELGVDAAADAAPPSVPPQAEPVPPIAGTTLRDLLARLEAGVAQQAGSA